MAGNQVVDNSKLVPYALRLPLGLKTRLEVAALNNGRSLNAEIVQRLKRTKP